MIATESEEIILDQGADLPTESVLVRCRNRRREPLRRSQDPHGEVNLVGAKVLLYAVNEADPRHDESRQWLDASLEGSKAVGFAWTVLVAFVRLSTKVAMFPNPLPVRDALERVARWTAQPPSVMVEATPRHLELVARLLATIGTGGNLVSDAHLAALALEHEAVVVSYRHRLRSVHGGPPATARRRL